MGVKGPDALEPQPALTPSEVAARLQVAKNTVYELIKRGELRGYRVGNQVRVDVADLEAFRNPVRATVPGAAPAVSAGPSLVISGQDVLLDLLARAVEQQPGVGRVLRSAVGSYPGLSGLYLGSVDAAAVHLWNPATGRYNADYVRALVPGTPTVTYRLATRTVGWYTAAGNPHGLSGWDDLGRSDLMLANRERGSGIRVLLDGRLAQLKVPRLRGYDTELPSHLAVAAAVARGEADLGLGNEKTSFQVAGVGFVPLQTEEYDLVFRRADRDLPAFQALVHVLRSPGLRRDLEGLGGYGLEGLGEVVDEA